MQKNMSKKKNHNLQWFTGVPKRCSAIERAVLPSSGQSYVKSAVGKRRQMSRGETCADMKQRKGADSG